MAITGRSRDRQRAGLVTASGQILMALDKTQPARPDHPQ
jgi:hypothetical protein